MRVVLVRLSALGDIVHTWPLAEAIRRARPEIHLTWVVEEPFAALVDGHPAVDAVVTTATGRWRAAPLARRTRAEIAVLKSRFNELAPDLAIDAQGTLKSWALTRWTGAPRRVGLARPWRRELVAGLGLTETIPGADHHPHVVATNLELVRAVDGTPPAQPTHPDGRWLVDHESMSTNLQPPVAAILPGAGQPDKILSASTLAEVARHLADRGLAVTVVWGPSERSRADDIARQAGAGVAVAPPTNLHELVRILAGAALVVGGDTGPVHLAASLGVPTLAVFITTDPGRNGPLGARTGVVSGALPGKGPAGSATTGRAREIVASEILAAADVVLGSQN